MDRLPMELLCMVFSILPAEHIPSSRFVCRRFAHAGLQYLEVGPHFYLRRHSLDRLAAIANHPVLSQNICTMKFFVDVLKEFDTERAEGICHSQSSNVDPVSLAWLQNYKLGQAVRMNSTRMLKQFVEMAVNDREAIRKEQEALISDLERTIADIRLSCSRLSRLTTVSMDFLKFSDTRIKRPLHSLRPAEQSWFCYDHDCHISSFHIVCPALVGTVLDGKSVCTFPALRSLLVEATDYSTLTCQSSQTSKAYSSLKQLQEVTLTSYLLWQLDDTISNHDQSLERCNGEETGPLIQSFLSNSPNLEAIDIEINAEPDLSTKTILQNCYWNKLRMLSLSRVVIERSTFETFLAAHAGTLDEMVLCDAEIRAGSDQHGIWISFLTFVYQNTNLTELGLYGHLSERRGIWFDWDWGCNSNTEGKDVPVCRVIRYLACGKATDQSGKTDDLTEILIQWDDLSWSHVEGVYDR